MAGLMSNDDEWAEQVARRRRARGRADLAAAVPRRLRRADQGPLRGHRERGREPQGGLDHGRRVPAPLRRPTCRGRTSTSRAWPTTTAGPTPARAARVRRAAAGRAGARQLGRARPALMFTSALAAELAPDVLERFLRYVRVDTQSSRDAGRVPSTPGQFDLARMLAAELEAIGLADVVLDDNCYVTATLPATVDGDAPVIGLLAHLDVSPDAPGAGVEPIVHRGYDGGVLTLPRGGTVLDPAAVDALADKAGHDIVTSSGDTLLGADDKAGVAEIMAAVAYLAAHPRARAPDRAGRLHARRGDRGRGCEGVRHRGVRRGLRLHARRLRGRRAAGRDVHRLQGHADDPRRRHPHRLGEGQARQRRAARGADRERAARRPGAGDDLGARGVRPPLRGAGAPRARP